MVEAAEQRKTADRHRLAQIVAVAFNEPKRLDEVAPRPQRPKAETASHQGSQQFEREVVVR